MFLVLYVYMFLATLSLYTPLNMPSNPLAILYRVGITFRNLPLLAPCLHSLSSTYRGWCV